MKERPILFSGPMVRAILAGTKTQTRRPVKSMPPQPEAECHPKHQQKHPAPYFDAYCGQRKTEANPRGMSDEWCWWQVDDRQCLPPVRCPYGQPGDRLWVRETWKNCWGNEFEYQGRLADILYRADGEALDAPSNEPWRTSIHMPRWACRLVLEIVSVRVQRVQDISEADALAEGMQKVGNCTPPNYDAKAYQFWNGASVGHKTAVDSFRSLWDTLYAAKGHGWDDNPWVWVVEFKRAEASA